MNRILLKYLKLNVNTGQQWGNEKNLEKLGLFFSFKKFRSVEKNYFCT